MRRVLVESPFTGDVERNIRYLTECMRDCISRNEAPFASHMMYTQVLDDDIPSERLLGIRAGFAWGAAADATVVYNDLGMTQGMKRGVENAEISDRPVEYRSLPGWAAIQEGLPKSARSG